MRDLREGDEVKRKRKKEKKKGRDTWVVGKKKWYVGGGGKKKKRREISYGGTVRERNRIRKEGILGVVK